MGSEPPAGRATVLVVEDDDRTRERLARAVKGHERLALLDACASVAEATARLAREAPDVLLTDLGLPDGSGIDVIRRARAGNVRTQAMVVTVLGDEETVLRAIEAGATGYLLKDDEIVELLDGGSPISPSIARLLLRRVASSPASDAPDAAAPATGKVKFKATKKGTVVTVSRDGNFPIPDAPSAQENGYGLVTAKVGGKLLQRARNVLPPWVPGIARIRDIDVTIQTTGTGTPGPGGVTNAATSLQASLTAPDGTTVWLVGGSMFTFALVGDNVGPLTLDDQAPNRLGGSAALEGLPTLTAPYKGRAQPDPFTTAGLSSLSAMNDGRVSGTWTLRLYDIFPAGTPGISGVNVLNSWSVRIRYGKPYEVSP